MPLGALVLALPALGLLRTSLDAGRCEEIAGEAAKAEPRQGAKELQERAEAELGLTAGAAEFFAEAVGLAVAKPDFAAADFCKSVDHALECSLLMDTVLTSTPVSDIAYGECVRSGEDPAYCTQFSATIKQADVETDLDTLRACYLLKEVKGAGPIVVPPPNATSEFGAAKPPGPIQANATVATPFGVHTEEATVPVTPPRITVEPMHMVRKNGSLYNASVHIVTGDGNLHTAGNGTAASKDLPWVPPPTAHEVAVTAAAEGGRAAGAAVGSALGHEVGSEAGEKAGVAVGEDLAESHNGTHKELSDEAYKAGFEAGQRAGKDALSAALVNLTSITVHEPLKADNATVEAAKRDGKPAKAAKAAADKGKPAAAAAGTPAKDAKAAKVVKGEKEAKAARPALAAPAVPVKLNASALATKTELKEATKTELKEAEKTELKNELKTELKSELKTELKTELEKAKDGGKDSKDSKEPSGKDSKEEYSGFLSKFVDG